MTLRNKQSHQHDNNLLNKTTDVEESTHPKIKSVFATFNILAVMYNFYVLPSDTKSTFSQFHYTEKLFVEFTLFAK